MVLGHSFLCSGEMWREQVPVLARQFRVINADPRGHGRSGPARHPFTLYDAVSDVVAVLDRLGIERAVWCGLSIGGMVALRAALTCPERVSGLVLMDTDGGAETALRKLKYGAMGAGARALWDQAVHAVHRTADVRGHDPQAEPHAGSRVEGALRGRAHPVRPASPGGAHAAGSLLARLGQIRAPALVLVGDEDRSLPPPVSRRLHQLLGDSTFAIVPQAGHLSALEQPAPVTEAIQRFLEARAS